MHRVLTRFCIACSIGAIASASAALATEHAKSELTFEKDILPIFRVKCIRCHAGVEPKAGLNLTEPSSLLTGGKSGPALRIAAAEFSLLYAKIAEDEMPEVTPRVVSHGFTRGALVARIGGAGGPSGGGQAVNAVGSLQADVASAFVATETTTMMSGEATTLMVDAALVTK